MNTPKLAALAAVAALNASERDHLRTALNTISVADERRTVDTTTLAGLRQAERLHAAGWKQGRVGLFTTEFFRSPKPRRTNQLRALGASS